MLARSLLDKALPQSADRALGVLNALLADLVAADSHDLRKVRAEAASMKAALLLKYRMVEAPRQRARLAILRECDTLLDEAKASNMNSARTSGSNACSPTQPFSCG